MVCNSFNDDANTSFSEEMKSMYASCAAVINNLLLKSPRYFNLNVGRSFLPVGSADPNTIFTNFNSAIGGKHIHLVRGLDPSSNDATFNTTVPNINYHGISFRTVALRTAEYVTETTYLPMCYYQYSEELGMQCAVFTGGRLYLKFPHSYATTSVGITHKFPPHLCLFNVGNVHITVYYTVAGTQGMFSYDNTSNVNWPKSSPFMNDSKAVLVKDGKAYTSAYLAPRDVEMSSSSRRSKINI